jgi:arsenate reductase-like glutaredoxin family protein
MALVLLVLAAWRQFIDLHEDDTIHLGEQQAGMVNEQATLARKVGVIERVNARKERINPKEALHLVRTARRLFVARGKKVVAIDFARDAPSDAELKTLIIGPSGNLRAPTLRVGDRLFIGFNAEEIGPSLWGGG